MLFNFILLEIREKKLFIHQLINNPA